MSVEKSRAEIERTVMRYGATGFISGWMGQHAMVTFEIKDRRVRFLLPLPDRNAEEFWHTRAKRIKRRPEEAYREWEQACRQRWRALALAVKAKMEAVETGIASFEDEWLAYFVLPDNSTVAERLKPKLDELIQYGKLPPLLPVAPAIGPRGSGNRETDDGDKAHHHGRLLGGPGREEVGGLRGHSGDRP